MIPFDILTLIYHRSRVSHSEMCPVFCVITPLRQALENRQELLVYLCKLPERQTYGGANKVEKGFRKQDDHLWLVQYDFI